MAAQFQKPLAILRRKQVEARTGKSRSGIYADISAGTFPSPISLSHGGKSVGWLEHEIDAWIAARVIASRQGGK